MALHDLYAAIWDREDGAAWRAHHRLTAGDYEAVLDELSGKGFRLRSVSGYEGEGEDLYVALFEQTDAPAWLARHRMTADDYRASVEQLGAEGYRLCHVSGYAVNGQDLYAAVWERDDGPASRSHYRLTADEYQATSDRLAADGYRLSCVSAYAVDDQDLYAAIWEQADGPAWQAHHRLDAAGLQQLSEMLARDGFLPVLLTACSVGGRDLYAGLWQQGVSPETVAHYGLPSPGFREISDQMEAEGYRPRALTAFAGVHAFDNVALPVPVQLQCQSNWCWAAAGVSIDRCYKSISTLTQCQLANKKFNGLDCCGTDGPGACNKTAKLEDVLSLVGHRDRFIKTPVDIQTLRQELAHTRPLGVRIQWAGGTQGHFVVVSGCYGVNGVVVMDPDRHSGGVVHTTYDVLRNSYRGSGTWTTTYFTKG